MEDPLREIKEVIPAITAADTPEAQKAGVLKYYAPDAAFRHPLCEVQSGPGSRDAILGIMQWYRVMSPRLKIEVKNATYNASTRELFVEVVQEFHIRLSPLPITPARLLVHLVLQPSAEDDSLYQIALHEDFYHPGDFAALIMPPVMPVISCLLKVGTVASNVNARLAGILGFWYPKNGTKRGGNGADEPTTDQPSGSQTYASVAANGGKTKSE